MKYVDLIIFDLDGTLIDSRQDIAGAVNYTLGELGLREKSISQISSYIGRGVQDLIRKSLGGKQYSLFNKALPLFEEYYRSHCADNPVLYSGVKEILEHFKHKRKVIITNRPYEFATPSLRTTGIYEYFVNIIGSDNIDCRKPSSCPIDKSMQELDINRERAIMVGDMDIDVLAGKRAGITTCAVTYGIGKKEDILRARPDHIIDNILQLREIIN